MKEDVLKIINHYGVSNQLKKLSEEVFEFQEAVIEKEKAGTYPGIEEKEHIKEELGDIIVILTQFANYYGIEFDEDLLKMMNAKVERQLKRMEKE